MLIAAGGKSNDPVVTAARLARDRARIVDIGKTSLDMPWNDYYEKELDVRFSRSYGPGRYDDRYELEGIDYPASYVRWTERRNLGCFLDLIAGGQLELTSLVSGVHVIDDAAEVYQSLRNGSLDGIGHLLRYPDAERAVAEAARPSTVVRSRPPLRQARPLQAVRHRLHRGGQLRHPPCCYPTSFATAAPSWCR